MSAHERAGVLAVVAASPLSKRQTLAEIGIPRRTYYNWIRQEQRSKSGDGKSKSRRPWNKLKVAEEELVIDQARALPDLSPRQLVLRLVDKYGCWISESTAYRILRREGLVKRAEVKGFAAGKEYLCKTNRMRCGLPIAAT